jgi:hypothetical protein
MKSLLLTLTMCPLLFAGDKSASASAATYSAADVKAAADEKRAHADQGLVPLGKPAARMAGFTTLPRLAPCAPLADNKKSTIDEFIAANNLVMDQHARYLQHIIFNRIAATDDTTIKTYLRGCLSSSIDPFPRDLINIVGEYLQNNHPEPILAAALSTFTPAELSGVTIHEYMEAESKAFEDRYTTVDSAITNAGADEDFTEFIENGHQMQSEGLQEAEIKQFQNIGLETSGEDTKEGSLVYWISCNTCNAAFKAGWNHSYYHKPTCRFYKPFVYAPSAIENPAQRMQHLCVAVDLAATRAREARTTTPTFATWDKLVGIVNSMQCQMVRWKLFLEYSEADFEQERQKTQSRTAEHNSDTDDEANPESDKE